MPHGESWISDEAPRRWRLARRGALLLVAVVVLAGIVGGVGALVLWSVSDDDLTAESTTTTLPPDTTPTTPPRPTTYIVLRGDTLSQIADTFRVSVAELVVANALPNPDAIKPGQVLAIPPQSKP